MRHTQVHAGESLAPIRVVQATGAVSSNTGFISDALAPCTGLVMVANRHGIDNPLARTAGVSHKCAVPVAGIAMLEHVVRALRSCEHVGRILISVEAPDVLQSIPSINKLVTDGTVSVVASGATISQSVSNATRLLGDQDYPLLITTGDNVLHTAEIIESFYTAAMASTADAAFALTPKSVLEQAYPEDAPHIGYLSFAEGGHSNCNIYLIRNSKAVRVAEVMKDGGQFRSHPWRILRTVGFVSLLLYKLRRLTLPRLCARLGRIFGVSIGIIILPHPDAPIDADGPVSMALIERILRTRGAPRHAA